jgi:AMMECR1 domain-containing protein
MQTTDISATQQHCTYCFQVLEAALQKQAMPDFPEGLPQIDVPVFVTFHVNEDELRGCIGTFSPGPIGKQL